VSIGETSEANTSITQVTISHQSNRVSNRARGMVSFAPTVAIARAISADQHSDTHSTLATGFALDITVPAFGLFHGYLSSGADTSALADFERKNAQI